MSTDEGGIMGSIFGGFLTPDDGKKNGEKKPKKPEVEKPVDKGPEVDPPDDEIKSDPLQSVCPAEEEAAAHITLDELRHKPVSRAAEIVEVLRELPPGKGLTYKEMVKLTGVSSRTVFRDVVNAKRFAKPCGLVIHPVDNPGSREIRWGISPIHRKPSPDDPDNVVIPDGFEIIYQDPVTIILKKRKEG
jgi:hypothetical protein